MKSYFLVDNKGFLHAFYLYVLTFLLLLIQLYQSRYETMLLLQRITHNGYYCELYLFHHISKQADHDEEEDNTPEEDKIVEDDSQELIMLTYRDCMISYIQKDNFIDASYDIGDVHQKLYLELDEQTKEIMDVVYEKDSIHNSIEVVPC